MATRPGDHDKAHPHGQTQYCSSADWWWCPRRLSGRRTQGGGRTLPPQHRHPLPHFVRHLGGALNITALACYASCFHLGCASWSGSGDVSRPTTSSTSTPATAVAHPLSGLGRPHHPQSNRAFHLFDNAPCAVCWISSSTITASMTTSSTAAWRPSPSRPPTTMTAFPLPSSRGGPNISPGSAPDDVACVPCSPRIICWPRRRCLCLSRHPHRRSRLRGWLHPPAEPAQSRHPPGAERILLVTLDSPHRENPTPRQGHLTSSNIASHLLNTVFSDTPHFGSGRLGRINQTLSLIPPRGAAD